MDKDLGDNIDELENVDDPVTPETSPDIDALVAAGIKKALSEIKPKLDAAYQRRDEAEKAANEAKEKLRLAELADLEKEGKHIDAYKLKIANLEESLAAATERLGELTNQNTQLTRTTALKDAMKDFSFKNTRAFNVAFKELEGQFEMKEGQWLSKDGKSVEDSVTAFLNDPDNSFLLKGAPDAGHNLKTASSGEPADKKPKSLFKRTQAEVLALAAEGKL